MAGWREGVHDHLPVTAGVHEPGGAEQPEVMGDEVMGPLDDPGQIAHAQLAAIPKRGDER